MHSAHRSLGPGLSRRRPPKIAANPRGTLREPFVHDIAFCFSRWQVPSGRASGQSYERQADNVVARRLCAETMKQLSNCFMTVNAGSRVTTMQSPWRADGPLSYRLCALHNRRPSTTVRCRATSGNDGGTCNLVRMRSDLRSACRMQQTMRKPHPCVDPSNHETALLPRHRALLVPRDTRFRVHGHKVLPQETGSSRMAGSSLSSPQCDGHYGTDGERKLSFLY